MNLCKRKDSPLLPFPLQFTNFYQNLQVICLGNITANLKQLFEIVKLPMNISANLRARKKVDDA
jgi:Zn-dependent membrane protease YugP